MKSSKGLKDLNMKELEEVNGGYKYVWGMRFTDDGKPDPTWDYVQGQLGNALINSIHF